MLKKTILLGLVISSTYLPVASADVNLFRTSDIKLSDVKNCEISYQDNGQTAHADSIIKKVRHFANKTESLTLVTQIGKDFFSIELSQQNRDTPRLPLRTSSRVFIFSTSEAASKLDYSNAQWAGGETLSIPQLAQTENQVGPIILNIGIGYHVGYQVGPDVLITVTCN